MIVSKCALIVSLSSHLVYTFIHVLYDSLSLSRQRCTSNVQKIIPFYQASFFSFFRHDMTHMPSDLTDSQQSVGRIVFFSFFYFFFLFVESAMSTRSVRVGQTYQVCAVFFLCIDCARKHAERTFYSRVIIAMKVLGKTGTYVCERVPA